MFPVLPGRALGFPIVVTDSVQRSVSSMGSCCPTLVMVLWSALDIQGDHCHFQLIFSPPFYNFMLGNQRERKLLHLFLGFWISVLSFIPRNTTGILEYLIQVHFSAYTSKTAQF